MKDNKGIHGSFVSRYQSHTSSKKRHMCLREALQICLKFLLIFNEIRGTLLAVRYIGIFK
jgi:hypothetical protein